MNASDLDELRQKLDASPQLKNLETRLQAEVQSRLSGDESGNDIGIDPFTILMIISVVIQVLQYCRNRNKQLNTELAAAILESPLIPARRTIRLRRGLNRLWAEYCAKNNVTHTAANPFLAAVYAVGAELDTASAAEFVHLTETR